MEKSKEVLMIEEQIRVLQVENKHLKVINADSIANSNKVNELVIVCEDLQKQYKALENKYSELNVKYKSLRRGIKRFKILTNELLDNF